MDFLLENEHFGLDSWRLCMEKNSFFVFNMKLWLNMFVKCVCEFEGSFSGFSVLWKNVCGCLMLSITIAAYHLRADCYRLKLLVLKRLNRCISTPQNVNTSQSKDLGALRLRSLLLRVPVVQTLFSIRCTSSPSNPVCCLIDTNEREADWIGKGRNTSPGANFST